jgi:hypothetical protein
MNLHDGSEHFLREVFPAELEEISPRCRIGPLRRPDRQGSDSIMVSATPKELLYHEKGPKRPSHKAVDPSWPPSKSSNVADAAIE